MRALLFGRITVGLLLLVLASNGLGAGVPEYNVKAGYLLAFARYVEWPAAAFDNEGSPFVIAVLGQDPFGRVLDETVQGQRVNGHDVQILRVADATEGLRAHIVFVARGQGSPEGYWIERLFGKPILFVGESTTTLELGGAVAFVTENNRVKFDVNRKAAQLSGLTIASPMLVAARSIYPQPDANGGNGN